MMNAFFFFQCSQQSCKEDQWQNRAARIAAFQSVWPYCLCPVVLNNGQLNDVLVKKKKGSGERNKQEKDNRICCPPFHRAHQSMPIAYWSPGVEPVFFFFFCEASAFQIQLKRWLSLCSEFKKKKRKRKKKCCCITRASKPTIKTQRRRKHKEKPRKVNPYNKKKKKSSCKEREQ